MKTELTKNIEKALFYHCMRADQCVVEEVDLYPHGIVDTLSYQLILKHKPQRYETVWRCYEIKVTKKDFYSSAKKTFVGHLNYFVMPEELYEEVKADIPSHIGVLIAYKRSSYKYLHSVARAKRQSLALEESFILRQFIGAQNREIIKAKKILWREEV